MEWNYGLAGQATAAVLLPFSQSALSCGLLALVGCAAGEDKPNNSRIVCFSSSLNHQSNGPQPTLSLIHKREGTQPSLFCWIERRELRHVRTVKE